MVRSELLKFEVGGSIPLIRFYSRAPPAFALKLVPVDRTIPTIDVGHGSS